MKSVISLLFVVFTSAVSAAPFWNPIVEEKSMYCGEPQATFKIQEQLFSEPQILWKQPKITKGEWKVFKGYPVSGWNMQLVAKICNVSEFRAQCVLLDPLKSRKFVQTINFLTGEFIFAEEDYEPVVIECYLPSM